MLLGQHRHRWGTREWVPIDSSSEPEVTIYISMEYTDSSNFQHAFASVYLYLKYRYSMTSKKQRRLCPWKEWKQHSCNKQQWRVKRFEEVSQIVTTCRNFRSSEGFGRFRKVSEAFSSNFPVMVGSWISLVWPSLKPSFSSPMHDTTWHNLTHLWRKAVPMAQICSNCRPPSPPSFWRCRIRTQFVCPSDFVDFQMAGSSDISDDYWLSTTSEHCPKRTHGHRHWWASGTWTRVPLSRIWLCQTPKRTRSNEGSQLLSCSRKGFDWIQMGIVHVKRLRLWCHQT